MPGLRHWRGFDVQEIKKLFSLSHKSRRQKLRKNRIRAMFKISPAINKKIIFKGFFHYLYRVNAKTI